jgi:hypothetical protein
MSILALTSNTLVTAASGQIEYNGQFFGTDSNASRAQLQRITSGTAVASTSGTSIDFTGIPAWVERITVMFNGVSLSGASNILVQLGDSGGIENTGYQGASLYITTGVGGTAANSAGFIVNVISTAAQVTSGNLIINLLDSSTNTFSASGVFGSTGSSTAVTLSGGAKSLSATLDRVRITTVNGTDTFDAGTINIMYEG